LSFENGKNNQKNNLRVVEKRRFDELVSAVGACDVIRLRLAARLRGRP
jgi:hypothetical protein